MLPNVLHPNATDHVPVLADQVREALAVQPGETVVDATFGAGGHAELLAADLQGSGKLIAIDREVVVAGVNDHLEIWDRTAWRDHVKVLEGSAEDVAERLASQRD